MPLIVQPVCRDFVKTLTCIALRQMYTIHQVIPFDVHSGLLSYVLRIFDRASLSLILFEYCILLFRSERERDIAPFFFHYTSDTCLLRRYVKIPVDYTFGSISPFQPFICLLEMSAVKLVCVSKSLFIYLWTTHESLLSTQWTWVNAV